MSRRRPASRNQQDGFILLTVIALLVVLAILAGAAAATANRVRDDQQRADQRLQGDLDAHSTRATMMYLLATQRMTFAGLTVDDQIKYSPEQLWEKKNGNDDVTSLLPVGNELRLDDTAYQGLGTSLFAMQADNGLLGINWHPAMLQRWLQDLKASPEQQTRLAAALLEYQKPDPSHFPATGSTAADKFSRHTLTTPTELRRVPGWNKLLAPLDDQALLQTVSTGRSGSLDVNTAPASVIALLPGVTPTMAERVVALRNVHAFTQYSAVYELLPTLDEDANSIGLFPSQSGTLSIWPDTTDGGRLVHWTLTPFEEGGRPWHIDYELQLPARTGRKLAPVRKPQTPIFAHTPAAHP